MQAYLRKLAFIEKKKTKGHGERHQVYPYPLGFMVLGPRVFLSFDMFKFLI